MKHHIICIYRIYLTTHKYQMPHCDIVQITQMHNIGTCKHVGFGSVEFDLKKKKFTNIQ